MKPRGPVVDEPLKRYVAARYELVILILGLAFMLSLIDDRFRTVIYFLLVGFAAYYVYSFFKSQVGDEED